MALTGTRISKQIKLPHRTFDNCAIRVHFRQLAAYIICNAIVRIAKRIANEIFYVHKNLLIQRKRLARNRGFVESQEIQTDENEQTLTKGLLDTLSAEGHFLTGKNYKQE
jgi:hypothetical protein